MHWRPFRHIAVLSAFTAALSLAGLAQGVHLKIPLTVSDMSAHRATIYFGVDPSATYCIDPFLGEFELPSDRCGTEPLCAYFVDSRDPAGSCLGNGLLLDFRMSGFTAQADTYRVAISAQNYPLTVRWPSALSAYYDSAAITDLFGGTIAQANMLATDSLVLANALVNQLTIHTWNPRGFIDGLREIRSTPTSFMLNQNYPNPFNPTTSIGYDLSKESTVSIRIFDVLGNSVATLVDERQLPGHHVVEWNPHAQPSGIYYCQLKAGGRMETRSMALIR